MWGRALYLNVCSLQVVGARALLFLAPLQNLNLGSVEETTGNTPENKNSTITGGVFQVNAGKPANPDIAQTFNNEPAYNSADNSISQPDEKVNAPVDNKPLDNVPESDIIKGNKQILPEKTIVEAKNASPQIADFIKSELDKNSKITPNGLFFTATREYGGKMSDNVFTPKDAYDAMELGVNKHILDMKDISLEKIQNMLDLLPTQTKRTEGQDKFQQFSTPPTIAYLANYAANITQGDIMLEPSAGIGGIAVFAKKDGAKVYVNELDPRRLEVLKNLPFDGFFNEDAEQINNILSGELEPTVVVMNPPFSSSGTRNVHDTKIGAKHIEQALKLLAPNGRLAAIVGQGMSDTAPAFQSWWKDIKSKYNVKANIGIDGKNYTKYGTNFGIQLLVIDKDGATATPPKTAHIENLSDLQTILEDIRDGRPLGAGTRGINDERRGNGVIQESGVGFYEGRPQAKTDEIVERARRTEESPPVTGNNKNEQRTSAATRENADRKVSEVSGGRHGWEPANAISDSSGVDDTVRTGSRVGDDSGKRNVVHVDAAESDGIDRGGRSRIASENKITQGADGEVTGKSDLSSKPDRLLNKRKKELTDSIFEVYQPQELSVKGAKPHPAKISESSAMNATEPPPITYKPNISQDIIDRGVLSDVQLEAVTYAGQSHAQTLPDGSKRAFFLGDGTGVGKGRTISGIILDNYNSGAKKAVWISMNDSLAEDASRDITALFGDASLVTKFEGGKKADKILSRDDAILFLTYGKLSSSFADKDSNFEKIIKWLGKDFDGVIAFDEAHKMGNSTTQNSGRSKSKATQTGLAGVKLQQLLPKAKIIYSSATGATDVQNLRYAERLGLWGEGTPFINGEEFVTKIKSGGIAAMELVARDLKAMGVYVSRNISYDDVKYDRLTHKLTKEQKRVYDELARAWQIIFQNIEEALKTTNQAKNGKAKGNVLSQFYGNQQRFFNQIITSAKVPSLIADIQKQLDNGNSAVIQLTNTNEAATDKAAEEAANQDLDIDELDITPKKMLMDYIQEAFPVHQYEIVTDDRGNEVSQPVIRNGERLINVEAEKQRDDLLDKLGSIKAFDNALDQIINHFGTNMVAESTGRKRRFVLKDGKKVEEKRGVNAKDADIKAFQEGKKRIIIFSEAGGTGKSYHADNTAKNQQHRVHYLLQAGWKADVAVQGFGRTHRSNQASAPTLVLTATDLKGENRFISTIAKRLDQLGALTKGQRQTGSQGLFSSSDNLESSLAGDVLAAFYRDLLTNKVDGIKGQEIIQKFGLSKKLTDEYGRFKNTAKEAREVNLFLNRILTLESGEQNAVFDAFSEKLHTATEKAELEGTLDRGLENYKADKIELNEVKDIREDKLTGAKTKYYNLTACHKIKPVKFADINTSAKNFMGYYKNKTSGIVRAVFKTSSVTDQQGNISDNYRLEGQAKKEYIPQHRLYNWGKITEVEAEPIWNDELSKLPEFSTQNLHLISGTVLPVWDKLPTENVRIYRVLVDGETLIGRMIPDNTIDQTLRRLGATRTREELSTDDLIKGIKNGDTLYLDNDWKITQRRISNENRIEITGPDYKYNDVLSTKGVFMERIQYQTRYFIPAEKDTEKVLDEVLKLSPFSRREIKGIANADGDVRSFKGITDGEQPVKRAEVDTKNNKNASLKIGEIIKYMSDKFKIPINTGNIDAELKDSLGIFKVKPKTIRTRIANSLPIISHDFGHYFDEKYNLSKSEHINEVVDAVNPDFLKKYPKKEIAHEAVAEFIRLYLQDRAAAEKMSQGFYHSFREKLGDGGDLKHFDTTANYINKYMSSGFDERVDAAIVSGKSNRNFSIGDLRRKEYMELVDSFAPIKDVMDYVKKTSEKEITGQTDSYVLATNSRNASAVADYIIKHGMTDLDGNIAAGQSFVDCIKEIDPKNLGEFDRYLVLKHSLDWLEPENNKVKRVFADDTLQNPELIKKSIAAIEKEYPKMIQAAENLYEFQRNMMKNFYVDGGGMTQRFMNHLNKVYPNYVPFQRSVNKNGGKIKVTFANQRLPIRRAKGSGLEIISPLESITRNVEKAVKFGTRNRVMQVLGNHADTVEGIGRYIERVPPDMIPHSVSIRGHKEKLSELLEEKLSEEDVTNVTELINEVFGDNVVSFSPIVKSGKNIVTALEKGEAKYYQIHDPLLYKAVAELSPQQLTGFLKLSQSILTPVKMLITQNNPIFAGTNAIRDIQTAYKNSDINNPAKFSVNYLKSAYEVISGSEEYKLYKAIGGGHSSELSATRDLLKKVLRETNLKDSGKARQLFSAITHPVDTIAGINDFIETLPRFTEFMHTKKKTGDIQSAIYAADDITTNFKRTGTAGRNINAVIMFSNADIQGLDRFFRSFTDVPPNERFKRALKYIIGAVFTTALLAWWNRENDKEGYENLSSYMKNNFYAVSLGDGNFLRIPKARELGVLDSTFERLVDSVFGDEEAFYHFGGYLANQFLPPFMPSDFTSVQGALHSVTGNTAFGPLFDIGFNRDFKGTPIVPKSMERLEKFEQYNERTTAAAYWVSQIFNWSPVQLDHAISGYTGILGEINRGLAPLDGERRDWSIGVKNRFVADSNYSTDIINKAYDARDKTKTTYKRKPTGENAIKYEKWAIVTDYISNINKAVAELPPEEQREARGELLSKIKKWSIRFNETDKIMSESLKSGVSDEKHIVTSLPEVKLERTVNGIKYTYTMSPAEYSEYIDEYLQELEKERGRALRAKTAPHEVMIDRLRDARVEAAATVREKYKRKLWGKFDKVG